MGIYYEATVKSTIVPDSSSKIYINSQGLFTSSESEKRLNNNKKGQRVSDKHKRQLWFSLSLLFGVNLPLRLRVSLSGLALRTV